MFTAIAFRLATPPRPMAARCWASSACDLGVQRWTERGCLVFFCRIRPTQDPGSFCCSLGLLGSMGGMEWNGWVASKV